MQPTHRYSALRELPWILAVGVILLAVYFLAAQSNSTIPTHTQNQFLPVLLSAQASPVVTAQPAGGGRLFLPWISQGGLAPLTPLNDPVMVGAGDIAVCYGGDPAQSNAAQTARVIGQYPDAAIFTLGDNSNEDGSGEQYADCFGPTWGQYLDRIHPTQGNHDTYTDGGAPYYTYFGESAGPAGQGWYSYDLGAWHIVVLNGNCAVVDGCDPGSPQETWLAADLAAHPARCTLAYWHQPRFSSGSGHGNDPDVQPLWEDLYTAGAEIVLNGHDHDYERFAPQDPTGQPDEIHGIREFVAGTGGAGQREFGELQPNSQVRQTGSYGVLKLTLHAYSYDWEFITTLGPSITDSGTTLCH
jgi:acid phosphatase type 7